MLDTILIVAAVLLWVVAFSVLAVNHLNTRAAMHKSDPKTPDQTGDDADACDCDICTSKYLDTPYF